jgi:hypothetical protein
VFSDLGASGYADRALRGSALSRSGLSTPRCSVPRLNPFNPLRTNRQRLRRTHRRGSALPDGPDIRVGWIRGSQQGRPLQKTGFIKAARRAIAIQTSVPLWAPIPCARTDSGYASPWPRAPGSSCRLDQRLAIGQTPAKPGSSRRPAAGQTPARPCSPGRPAAGQTPAKSGSSRRPAAGQTPAKPDSPGMPAAGQTPARPCSPGRPAAGQTLAKPDSPGMPAAGQTPAKPGSSRRLAVPPRSNNACRLGHQSLAHEPARRTNRRGSAHPDLRIGWPNGASQGRPLQNRIHRGDPPQGRPPQGRPLQNRAHRGGPPCHRNTLSVQDRAPIPCARTDSGYASPWLRAPGSSWQMDQRRITGQTPAKPDSPRRPAAGQTAAGQTAAGQTPAKPGSSRRLAVQHAQRAGSGESLDRRHSIGYIQIRSTSPQTPETRRSIAGSYWMPLFKPHS